MQNHSKILGNLIEKQRFEHKRLTRKALASLLGFRDLGKGVWKIEQSVLAKAFRGELVEPDPNDEPAEILLKRILDVRASSSLR